MNEFNKEQQAAANISTLRSVLQTQVELRHRVTGAKIQVDRDVYESDRLADSGYNPKDWVLASEWKEHEPRDRTPHPGEEVHPAFVGTDQRIGNFLGQTPEERAQSMGVVHPEHGLGINGGAMADPAGGNQVIAKSDPVADAKANREAAVAKVEAVNPGAVVTNANGEKVVDLNAAKGLESGVETTKKADAPVEKK